MRVNGLYKTYDTAKNAIITSGYKLFRNKLFTFDVVASKWCKFKKITVTDTYNGKVLKQIVKEIKK